MTSTTPTSATASSPSPATANGSTSCWKVPRASPGGNGNLSGVYTATGDVVGPWTRIADSVELENSGSAIVVDQGYPVGIQAWYNNFIEVDPGNAQHVYVGLEEVYETEDGGATWKTIGPYWNFGFDCFDPADPAGCPATTHPDQHSIAVAGGTVYIGNDGGVYSRPLAPAASPRRPRRTRDRLDQPQQRSEHASVLLRRHGQGPQRSWVPRRGWPTGQRGLAAACPRQQAGEPVRRRRRRHHRQPARRVPDSQRVRVPHAVADQELWAERRLDERHFDVTVPEINARFTAPFRTIRGSKNIGDGASERWVAGGNSFWRHDFGFSYTEAQADADLAKGWLQQYALDETGARLIVGLDAVANPSAPADPSKDTYIASWCGQVNCNSAGFTRGVATNWGGTWKELDMTGLPNRFPNAVIIGNKLVVGTDLAVFVADKRAGADTIGWRRVGLPITIPGLSLPLTTVFDLHVSGDGFLYAATHGRGIWKTPLFWL